MTDGTHPDDAKRGKVVRFAGREGRGERPPDPSQGDVIPIAAAKNGEPLPVSFSGNAPQRIIALAVVLVICYFGRLVIIPVLVSIILAFMLAPFVGRMERWRIPRPLGSAIAVLLLSGLVYVASYFFYLRAVDFVKELPRIARQIGSSTLKYRQQAKAWQQTREAITPEEPEEKRAVPVKQVDSTAPDQESAFRIVDTVVSASFIPFLVYFMLSWQGHIHRSTVQLFPPEHRTNAYVTISNMTGMMRGFIVGNIIVGIILGAISTLAFWALGVPYFYFVGFISGFVSLVPYLGVVLALVPPLATSFGQLSNDKLLFTGIAVVVVHLVGLNVLYPKVLGRHVQLNPLVVTAALLLFWFLWGGMGLLLAIPVTAAIKVVCDHVPELGSWGYWLSEGEES